MADVPAPVRPSAGSVRVGLGTKISALVLIVLLATVGFAFVVIGQLRALQASFDLLTTVYVVFNQRLTDAQVQAVRIQAQVSAPEVAERPSPAFMRNFEEGLRLRNTLIREAAELVAQAVHHGERFGGPTATEGLAELDRELRDIVAAIESDQSRAPIEVLRDARAHSRVETGLKRVADRSGRAILDLQFAVRAAQQNTERITLTLTLAVAIVGVLAAFGVFLTLRPLRRLTLGVRRLAGGDWRQRIAEVGSLGGVDEVTELAREFDSMAQALQERERLLVHSERLSAAGQLAAQVAHEVRNPLSSLALNLELLRDELPEADAEVGRLLDRIATEVDRLEDVTDDYLTFARGSRPELVIIDLCRELSDLLEFLAGEHDRLGIAIDRDFPATAPVLGDAKQLRQAFLNLLRNAREAVLEQRPPEAGSPRIAVSVTCKDGEVVAIVQDNGRGIPPGEGDLERVFEAFYTTKPHGTGLGLPIVHKIVQDHGGRVRVRSTGPEGTRIEVVLPACNAEPLSVSSAPDSVPLRPQTGERARR